MSATVHHAHALSQPAIEARLLELGYRMECSLSCVDDEGHAVIEVYSGECVDPPPGEVLDLALAWSEIEGN
jgi:hypothetical protein